MGENKIFLDENAFAEFTNIAVKLFGEITALCDNINQKQPYTYTATQRLLEASFSQKKEYLTALSNLCDTAYNICTLNGWEVEKDG